MSQVEEKFVCESMNVFDTVRNRTKPDLVNSREAPDILKVINSQQSRSGIIDAICARPYLWLLDPEGHQSYSTRFVCSR